MPPPEGKDKPSRTMSNVTIADCRVVYDLDLPEGEIHLNPLTKAEIEQRCTSVTVIHHP